MNLSQPQIEKIRYHCGYRSREQMAQTPLTEPFSDEEGVQIQRLIDELDAIDLALAQARSDSMATKIDTIDIDFPQHIRHLMTEGARLVAELAHLVDIRVHRNKYGGGARCAIASINY